MYSWGGCGRALFAHRGEKIKERNLCNVMKSVTQLCKGPHSSQDFWVIHCRKTALCIMGNIMKFSTISFVNLFTPFFSSHRHTAKILLLSNTTPCTSFHASAAAWQVESAHAAKGPAAHHMDQMKSHSQRQRRYGLLMEDWLVTVCVVEAYSERKRFTHAFWGAPVFLKTTESYYAALLNLRVKKKWQENNTGKKFYLPIFAGTLLFLSYFFLSFQSKF